MYCLSGPLSPRNHRHEVSWGYSQGAPMVFKGDLYYYSVEYNAEAYVDGIDTTKCPLYLLTGEYDLSATPQLTAELARATGARHFEVMKGMGHFPMSENPAAFLGYLRPVLDRIARD